MNSFLSLASQGFYDDTTCHRLTTSDQLNILQCGDPTGRATAVPGTASPPRSPRDATYPVGTVALANAGADTNGSQFFIVYGTTTLSPAYTILGTVTGDGMSVVNGIAAQGVQKGAQDGPPVAAATIAKVTVPDGALDGTGTYETASPVRRRHPTGCPPTPARWTRASVDTGSVDTGAATPTDGATPTDAPTAEATAESTAGAG